MRFYKASFSILLTIICSTFVLAQNSIEGQRQKKKFIPQFDFTQIDSLVDDAIHKIISLDSQATVVASVRWYIGSYSDPTDKFSTHSNHFDIYIFNFADRKCSIQKIDNFGYFRVRKIDASNIKDFLSSHFIEMQSEELNPKTDTVTNPDESITTIRNIVDHQLSESIKIVRAPYKLDYEYPADYSANKYNLLTKRFKFLSLVGELQKRYDEKKHKRVKVIHGLYEPEY